jgi:effector-binding domain-containing protein
MTEEARTRPTGGGFLVHETDERGKGDHPLRSRTSPAVRWEDLSTKYTKGTKRKCLQILARLVNDVRVSRNLVMLPYQIELANSEATLTAVVRERVLPRELSKFIPAACGEVWAFVRAARLPKPGRHVALYLDANGSVEVGAEVSAPFVGNERIHCSRLPSGRRATTVHFGPYQQLFEAHAAIRQWCAEHAHMLTGISWEIYGHWDESWNANPAKIRTDVFYLLRDQCD